MKASSSCPETFHLCPRSAAHDGFSVVDRATGEETSTLTCAEARRVAEARYPGCAFALSTIRSIHKDAPSSMPDAVIVAILRRMEGDRATVLAYVVASVEGTGCIPFAADVWHDVLDHLPRDHRRKKSV
jgi:hypothetical protein